MLSGSASCGNNTAEYAMLTPACITILCATQLASTCKDIGRRIILKQILERWDVKT
jgi:hypothetical protein